MSCHGTPSSRPISARVSPDLTVYVPAVRSPSGPHVGKGPLHERRAVGVVAADRDVGPVDVALPLVPRGVRAVGRRRAVQRTDELGHLGYAPGDPLTAQPLQELRGGLPAGDAPRLVRGHPHIECAGGVVRPAGVPAPGDRVVVGQSALLQQVPRDVVAVPVVHVAEDAEEPGAPVAVTPRNVLRGQRHDTLLASASASASASRDGSRGSRSWDRGYGIGPLGRTWRRHARGAGPHLHADSSATGNGQAALPPMPPGEVRDDRVIARGTWWNGR
jgi:hypothetical protein